MMRIAASGVVWLLICGAAHAQGNPACDKYKNDYEYNACLAKQGPKAGATRATAAPGFDGSVTGGRGALAVKRNKRGRSEAVFDVAPRK
jgi:hypothetical protein